MDHITNKIPKAFMDQPYHVLQQEELEWDRSRRVRLPTFSEVLTRKARPPVDLFMF
jgi:hypothetical protein